MQRVEKKIFYRKICVLILCSFASFVYGITMQSTNYIIQTETHDSGGANQSSSNYSTLTAFCQNNISDESVSTSFKTYNGYINTIEFAPPPPTPPGVVTLLWPTNGLTDVATTGFSLFWEEPATGTLPFTYTVEVDDNSNYSSPEISQTGITDTMLTISGLNNSTTYYWRVRDRKSVV